jgi:4'-phosphopantetheinyl transferase
MERAVVVWLLALDALDAGRIARAGAVIDDRERAQAERFLRDDDRRTFVAAHALLRLSLAPYVQAPPERIRFAPGGDGKPRLAAEHGSSELDFSLSHSHGLVACAVGRGAEVGADVEWCGRRTRLAFLLRLLSPEEREAVGRLPDSAARRRAALEAWTMKEALLKGRGTGLRAHLSPSALASISFDLGLEPDGREPQLLRGVSEDDASRWSFRRLHLEASHVGTIATAVDGSGERPGVRQLDGRELVQPRR